MINTTGYVHRKTRTVTRARQWNGLTATPPAPAWVTRQAGLLRKRWQLKTPDGWRNLRMGDWIVYRGFYEYLVLRPDAFEREYEPTD